MPFISLSPYANSAMRERTQSFEVLKQFCVRILLVPWKCQLISSCFLNELFKKTHYICSSTSNFSLDKVSTDLSGNFAWKYSCNYLFFLYLLLLVVIVIWNLFLFLLFLWNLLVATFCNSLKGLCSLVAQVLWPHCFSLRDVLLESIFTAV